MKCKQCEYWSNDYGFCRISTTKPLPTGNPKTCPFYERKG